LKSLLTSAPILRNVDPNEDFVVCTNACKEGLGGVLSQNGHVIFYESIMLKDHERLYATHDLELVSITLAASAPIHVKCNHPQVINNITLLHAYLSDKKRWGDKLH
jgi:hypothetical protein